MMYFHLHLYLKVSHTTLIFKETSASGQFDA